MVSACAEIGYRHAAEEDDTRLPAAQRYHTLGGARVERTIGLADRREQAAVDEPTTADPRAP